MTNPLLCPRCQQAADVGDEDIFRCPGCANTGGIEELRSAQPFIRWARLQTQKETGPLCNCDLCRASLADGHLVKIHWHREVRETDLSSWVTQLVGFRVENVT